MRFPRLHLNAPHYFARHLSLGLEELYILVGLNDLAVASIMVFEPIYLYALHFSLARIAAFYAVVYLLYTLLIPLGGIIAARFGYPRTILLSSWFLVAYYTCLFSVAFNPAFVWFAAVAFAIQKILYWPAMQADFIRFANHQQEGKELSGIVSLSTIVNVIGPLLGGLLIKLYGFPALFGLVIALVILSNLPLFFSTNPPTHEPQGYRAAWRQLFTREHRNALIAGLGFSEELVVLVFWPIAIYLVVRNFAEIGSLVALATLVTALITLYIGKLVDQHRQRKLIRFGSAASSVNFLARFIAVSPPLVFLVDTFSRLFKSMLYVPFLELTYERAEREGPLKTVVFFEQSLAIGKLLTAALFVLVFYYTTNLGYAFVWAAATALLYRWLVR